MGMYNDKPLTAKDLAVKCGKSMTKQAFKDEVDINKIVKQFEKTGMVEHLNENQPFYGDVSELKGYQEALNVVNEADALFMAMSPAIRERFDNDPAKMIRFLEDPKNNKEAVDLGMVVEQPKEKEAVKEPPKP